MRRCWWMRRTLELPLLDKMWKEIGKEWRSCSGEVCGTLHAKLAPLAELYARADGFCIVSAEYNHSIPPGMSNLIDYFLEEYFWRPSAIVCYSQRGPFGGVAGGDAAARNAGGGGDVVDPFDAADPFDWGCAEQGWGGANAGIWRRSRGSSSMSLIGTCARSKVERAKGVPY